MRRGTTATIQFTLPFATDSLISGTVSIIQKKGETILTMKKDLSECQRTEDKIVLKLTQEETLEMSDDIGLQIQLKVKTDTNDVLASEIYRVDVGSILDEVVL